MASTHTTDSLCNQKEKVEVSRVLQKKNIKILTTVYRAHMLLLNLIVNVLLWRASLHLLMIFLLVKMADGQFRSLLICPAGGQHFLCCGLIQLNLTSTTSESTSRVHSSSLDAFNSPISLLYQTLLPPLTSATSAWVTWRAIFCSLFAQVKHCQWWAPAAIKIMQSHIWWDHCANSGLFCSFTW